MSGLCKVILNTDCECLCDRNKRTSSWSRVARGCDDKEFTSVYHFERLVLSNTGQSCSKQSGSAIILLCCFLVDD
ncbi:hypothetical protein KIN20_007594 [Parelaphostrongylus tenuis]|uniref:Uncharacterized protein n=1 Tax=Parelaphostrongylus tenuis TaxID=148309 RepID=A0AAD5M3M7_PARTN|nr:hypothetical protein KIN20_007594 [Parelaphostrongylus tenuis]